MFERPTIRRQRNSKLDTLDWKKVEKLYDAGHDHAFIASFFEIDLQTWKHWLKTRPDFAKLIKRWERPANERVERSAYELAIGYTTKEVVFEKTGNLLALIDLDDEDIIFEPEYRKSIKIKTLPPNADMVKWILENRDPESWKTTVNVNAEDEKFASLLLKARDRVKELASGANGDIDPFEEPAGVSEATG